MNYNSIMIPLRIAAMVFAAIIGIFALCSFNHPFDIHYGIDEAIEHVQKQLNNDRSYERHREDLISFHNRPKFPESRESLDRWRDESDRELFGCGTCDFHNTNESTGTFND
jgi:hypothetical protein